MISLTAASSGLLESMKPAAIPSREVSNEMSTVCTALLAMPSKFGSCSDPGVTAAAKPVGAKAKQPVSSAALNNLTDVFMTYAPRSGTRVLFVLHDPIGEI